MHSFCINSNQMWCDQVQSIHILSRSDSKPQEVFIETGKEQDKGAISSSMSIGTGKQDSSGVMVAIVCTCIHFALVSDVASSGSKHPQHFSEEQFKTTSIRSPLGPEKS